jgi:ketosteroid isomerase-like protein
MKMPDDQTLGTREFIDGFYRAYLAGDISGMLDRMASDAVVTFNGHGTFRGLDEIGAYMSWAATQLSDMTFTITAKIIDGELAAVTWHETATTARGEPWEAIGVDVYWIADGKLTKLTVYSDTDRMRSMLDTYPGSVPEGIDEAIG